VVRWRCADQRDRIGAKFNIHLHERSVGKLLKKLFTALVAKVCFVGRPRQSINPEAASRLRAKNAIRRLAGLLGAGH
jgi:hypothetical protein